MNEDGCWSGIGQIDGYVGDAVFTEISETYAPENWQAIGLGSGCLDEYSIQQQGYFTYNIFSENTFFLANFLHF